MNDNQRIEQLILDYIDGKLSAPDHEIVKQYISGSDHYEQLEQAYRELLSAIDDDPVERPGTTLRDTFQNMLLEEESKTTTTGTDHTKEFRMSLNSFYRVAAVLTLMLVSYWLGNYMTKKDYLTTLAYLETQQQELKTLAVLSLLESESASKRIQAVAFSMELEQADIEIIDALIYEMLHDQLVNVRFASARALERFSEHEMVKNAFIQALKTEENATMQLELIGILSHLKEKRAIPKMKELLEDKDTPVFIKEQLKSELQHLI